MAAFRTFQAVSARVLTALALCAPLCTQAQSLWDSNAAFDQQFNAQLGAMQSQNQMQQQQLLQQFIQWGGPRLRQEYQQYVQATGQQIPFETFAYWHMMSQGGRAPIHDLQRRNFEALQGANRTVQEGHESYNRGYWKNQDSNARTFNNYSNGAVRGNAFYGNPQTGETHNLPHGQGEGEYRKGHDRFQQDPNGQYYQLDAQGYRQWLELINR